MEWGGEGGNWTWRVNPRVEGSAPTGFCKAAQLTGRVGPSGLGAGGPVGGCLAGRGSCPALAPSLLKMEESRHRPSASVGLSARRSRE